ncbi:putative succinyl-CoA ligase [GDP-forming] subunit beta [Venturia inaequalis]|nr:putative succinyl-CoA ligase [GDP-forming] subunit beta [Venturia inaequalis]
MDILSLDKRPVLYIVDVATVFQAGRFLKGSTVAEVWDAVRDY